MMWMGRMQRVTAAIGLIVAGLVGGSAHASVISKWTFETNYTPPAGTPTSAGPFLAEEGNFTSSAAASSVHASATTFSAVVGNGSAKSFSSNTWAVGDYYQFTTPTTGSSNIQLLVDQTASGTGPLGWKVAYSTDGTNFTDLPNGAYTLNTTQSFSSTAEKPTTPPRFLFDLSGVPALNDQANITLRLIDATAPSGSGGTSRIDNVTVGTDLPVPQPLPEPSTFALISIAAGVGLRRRRRM